MVNIGILIAPVEHVFTSGCRQQFYFILNILRNCEFEVCFLTQHKNFELFDLTNEHVTYIDESYDFADIDIILYGNDFLHKIHNKNMIQRIKKQNTKLIHCICGNYYHLYHEHMIFNVHGQMLDILHIFHDEIWVLEIYKEQKSFLELLFNVPVTVMPYVWTSYFIDKYITFKNLPLLPDKHPDFSRDKINICIFEPNVSTHKSCFIPLLIANKYYQMYKNRVNKIFVFCSNAQIMNNLQTLDIVKDNKTEFHGKHIMLEMIHLIRQSNKYINIVISHNINNPLNFIHLEFLYLGIPLIHNSKPFEQNELYYHDEIDAVSLVEKTRLTFDLDNYINIGNMIIEQYSEKNTKRIQEYTYHSVKAIMN
jgi:hypothetical protein